MSAMRTKLATPCGVGLPRILAKKSVKPWPVFLNAAEKLPRILMLPISGGKPLSTRCSKNWFAMDLRGMSAKLLSVVRIPWYEPQIRSKCLAASRATAGSPLLQVASS